MAHLTGGSLRQLIDHEGWGAAGRLLWRAQLGALLRWPLAAVSLVAGLYFGLRAVFRQVLARQMAVEPPAALARRPAAPRLRQGPAGRWYL